TGRRPPKPAPGSATPSRPPWTMDSRAPTRRTSSWRRPGSYSSTCTNAMGGWRDEGDWRDAELSEGALRMITHSDYDDLLHSPRDGMIWHYTSVPAFLDILRTQSLWLNHHAFMNDPAEGRVGYTHFRNATCVVEVESEEDQVQIALRCARERRGPVEGRRVPSFLASFSLNGDALSQWARYADHGRGVALGF